MGLVWIFYTRKANFPRIICKIILFFSVFWRLCQILFMTISEWSFVFGSSNLLFSSVCVCVHMHMCMVWECPCILLCVYGGQRTICGVGPLFSLLSGFWDLNSYILFYFTCQNVEACASTMLFLLFWFWNIIWDQIFCYLQDHSSC